MIPTSGRACDIGTILEVFVRTFAQNFEFLSPHTPSLTTQPTALSPKGSTQSNCARKVAVDSNDNIHVREEDASHH